MKRDHLRIVESTPVHGRVPPHDLDAEAAVLSACLLERHAFDCVIETLKPEHFYSDANRRIFEAMVELTTDGDPIDIISVSSWLRTRELLQQVGGSAYVAQVMDATPAVAHVSTHAKIVFEKWRLRRLIATCQQIAAEGYGDCGPPQAFIENAMASIEDLVTSSATGGQLATVEQAVDEAYATLQQVRTRAGKVLGYSTGIRGLDECIGGLVPSDVTLVGARMKMPDGRIETTSAGKTAFVLTVAMHVAQNPYRTITEEQGQRVERVEPIGVVFFCMEMKRGQMAMRMACHVAQVNWSNLRRGRYTDPETGELRPDVNARIAEAMQHVRTLPFLFFTDKPLKPSGVRAKVLAARAKFARHGIKLGLVVIDSIGWMTPERESRENNREKELNEIGRALRDLSRDERIDGVHYIVVTQLQENGKPKDCTSLKDHAVNFAVIDVKNVEGDDEFDGTITVGKQRDGERDIRIPIRFLTRYGVFVDG